MFEQASLAFAWPWQKFNQATNQPADFLMVALIASASTKCRNLHQFRRNVERSSISKNDAKRHQKWCENLQKSMPKTFKNHPQSRLGRLLGASRTGVVNEIKKGNLGIIESGGFGAPKTSPQSAPKGFKKPSKCWSFFDIVFWSMLGRFGAPSGRHFGPFWRPCWPQVGPKTRLESLSTSKT